VGIIGSYIYGTRGKNKTKGCLHGKTQAQKDAFFESLSQFAINDPVFFEEQISDLKPAEQNEYLAWLKAKNKNLKELLKTVKNFKITL
jgi:hypothetical protein